VIEPHLSAIAQAEEKLERAVYGLRREIRDHQGIGEMMRRVDVIIQQKSGQIASSIITFPFHHSHFTIPIVIHQKSTTHVV